jgi:hypothetical protein
VLAGRGLPRGMRHTLAPFSPDVQPAVDEPQDRVVERRRPAAVEDSIVRQRDGDLVGGLAERLK